MDNKGIVKRMALSQYTPHNYRETEDRKGWVNYGDDNDYPDYLIDLFNESPTHGSLCKSLSQYLYGAGFAPSALDQYAFNKTLSKCLLDFKIHGYFFLEIVWIADRIGRIEYMPAESIRCGKRVGRQVPSYWYCADWSSPSGKNKPFEIISYDPNRADTHPNQILAVRPFSPGSFYYPKPDYNGAVEYCEIERRVSTFHNANLKNGMAPSFIIKMRNGQPSPEEQSAIERNIMRQMSGEANAGNVLIFYSDPGADNTPEIDTVTASDLDKQFQQISLECSEKIMVAHRVVSPLLFGLKTGGGLGSNADELRQADELMRNNVIDPSRNVILDHLQPLFNTLGIASIEWLDKVEEEAATVDESFTGIQISSAVEIVQQVNAGMLTREQGTIIIEQMLGFDPQVTRALFATKPAVVLPPEQVAQLSAHADADGEAMAKYLDEHGEEIDEEEWVLIDSRPETYKSNIEGALQLARVPSSNPNGVSEQDTSLFKVRYTYAPRVTDASGPSRKFCSKMVASSKVYRKEDIEAASDRAVNPGFGPGGTNTYDLWLYKGGPNCYHFWERRIYMRRNNKKITEGEARKMINTLDPDDRPEAKWERNDPNVARRPIDMPNNGYLNPPGK